MSERDEPDDLADPGLRLWRSVTEPYELTEAELTLLHEAARTRDCLDELHAVGAREGPIGEDGRVHPALVEARQQRITLSRLIAALRLPEDDGEAAETPSRRPQRRGAPRVPYRVGRAS